VASPLTGRALVQIDVLRRLNYRGANVAKISDDKVVEELLKA
jgi:ubiquitin-conjugating enzyme (huntingtin interacting protein 2)